MKQARPTVLYAAAVRDSTGISASPGAVLVQDGEIVAAGEPDGLPPELVQQAESIDRSGDLLLPAMVNAHTHLELTIIEPQPYKPKDGFVGWVKQLRNHINAIHAAEIDHSALQAGSLAREQGIQAVGDIASFDITGLRAFAGLYGVCFHELFGLGSPFQDEAFETIERAMGGLQPHAPYSAGPALFEAATRKGLPISTHLAETSEEAAFVGSLTGPLLDYIKSIGRWHDSFAEYYGNGLSPAQWMQPYFKQAASDGGWLVAHCNYVSDEDIAILADTNTSVAYCPLASEYFGHKDHRYRDMLVAGINVCLGTDSIVGTDPNDPQPLGLLSAMRRLYQRDQTDPETLLAMATTHGARALRLDHNIATLQPSAPARFAAIPIDPDSDTDPLVQVLTRQDPVEAISFEQST